MKTTVTGRDDRWRDLNVQRRQGPTPYAEAIGFPSTMFRFHDVYNFEPETWNVFIPQPVIAAVLCFEIKEQHKDLLDQEEKL